jgi:hypothetical protein
MIVLTPIMKKNTRFDIPFGLADKKIPSFGKSRHRRRNDALTSDRPTGSPAASEAVEYFLAAPEPI